MKRIFLIVFLCSIAMGTVVAQQTAKPIRIADTLTQKEKAERNPVLLRSELDSLVKLYAPVQLPVEVQKPVPGKTNFYPGWLLAGISFLAVMSILVMIFLLKQRKDLKKLAISLASKQTAGNAEGRNGKMKVVKKTSPVLTAERVEELSDEVNRLEKENANLNGVIREYNGIKHEYDSVKQGVLQAYKVKNYPGIEQSKEESSSICTVLDTEKAVANHAYTQFLKPVLVIADANKNNPAKMSSADKQKMVGLLVSLSLFYIEYLYLRVGELSVGGTIVERIRNFSTGNMADKGTLKTLNKEAGSRALVLRLALDNASVNNLSYPVFDETNINQ